MWGFHSSAEHVLTEGALGHTGIAMRGELKVASSRTLQAWGSAEDKPREQPSLVCQLLDLMSFACSVHNRMV